MKNNKIWIVLVIIVVIIMMNQVKKEADTSWCNGADINKDGSVDVFDLAIHSNNYDRTDCVTPTWCNGADINKDGSVDVFDLAILSNNYDRTDCVGPTTQPLMITDLENIDGMGISHLATGSSSDWIMEIKVVGGTVKGRLFSDLSYIDNTRTTSTPVIISLWVEETLTSLDFTEGDYITLEYDGGQTLDIYFPTISVPGGTIQTFYIAETGETYYNVDLCTIPGDTAPACNGIDRTELGNIAQQWINNPTSQLRTDLGLAAQDWINHGGIA